jgi:hypothetical protein
MSVHHHQIAQNNPPENNSAIPPNLRNHRLFVITNLAVVDELMRTTAEHSDIIILATCVLT